MMTIWFLFLLRNYYILSPHQKKCLQRQRLYPVPLCRLCQSSDSVVSANKMNKIMILPDIISSFWVRTAELCFFLTKGKAVRVCVLLCVYHSNRQSRESLCMSLVINDQTMDDSNLPTDDHIVSYQLASSPPRKSGAAVCFCLQFTKCLLLLM